MFKPTFLVVCAFVLGIFTIPFIPSLRPLDASMPPAPPPFQPVPDCLQGSFSSSGRELPTDGRNLTTYERDNVVDTAAQDALNHLSTSAYDDAVQRLKDANSYDQVCMETHGVTLAKLPAVVKSGGETASNDRVVFHPDVAAGLSPGETLAGVVASRGALLDGLGECQAYQAVLEYTCSKLGQVTSGSNEEFDLCAQLYETKQKLEERPENKDGDSQNDCLPSLASGCLSQCSGTSRLREGSDPLPSCVDAGDTPIPSDYITYFSEERSDSEGGSYDPVIYTAFTTCKSLQILFRVSGSHVGRRVIDTRIFPLAIALDDRDRDNPVVYLAGIKPNDDPILRKITFLDGPANDYSDFSIVTLSNPNFGYVSDMVFDEQGGSDLYIMDDSNDVIWIYDTQNPPTGTLPIFADDQSYSDLASMRMLFLDPTTTPQSLFVLVNASYQLACGAPSPIGVLWDSTGSGSADSGEFDTVANVVD